MFPDQPGCEDHLRGMEKKPKKILTDAQFLLRTAAILGAIAAGYMMGYGDLEDRFHAETSTFKCKSDVYDKTHLIMCVSPGLETCRSVLP